MTLPSPQGHDPITSILLLVTELRGDVKAALGRLEKHEARLDDHDKRLEDHGQRLVAIETTEVNDQRNAQRTVSLKAVMWGAVAALAAVVVAFGTVKGWK